MKGSYEEKPGLDSKPGKTELDNNLDGHCVSPPDQYLTEAL